MSDLFKTGSAGHKRGSFSVSYSGGSDIVKRLRKLENGGEVAIKRTVSDFTTRAPAWVSKGIREHYGVDAAAIKEAAKRPKRGATTIKVAGITVDGATLEYKGRLLTPLHFKMSPKKKSPKGLMDKTRKVSGQGVKFKKTPPGQVATVRPPKPYTVKATIIKGQRTNLPPSTFIAAGNGGASLPFQRKGESRMPIEAVRTLSVPQMIDGRARDTIDSTISEKLGERFQHHVERAMK